MPLVRTTSPGFGYIHEADVHERRSGMHATQRSTHLDTGKGVFCFIDDSSFELQLFRDVFEEQPSDTIFVYGTTFEEAQDYLQENDLTPALYILDLYGRTGTVPKPEIPPISELREKTAAIRTIDEVYRDLGSFGSDPDLQVNEYLKRLFSVIGTWRSVFSELATRLDQSPGYGIKNLKSVRACYPDTAAVMYTRKGLFADAVRVADLGCDGIFMKPMGQTDAEILAATKAQREQ